MIIDEALQSILLSLKGPEFLFLFTSLITNELIEIAWYILFRFRYLQEIGYTDKVLDMRSARVRSLLGITTDDLPSDNENINSARENRAKKNEARQQVPENEEESAGANLQTK